MIKKIGLSPYFLYPDPNRESFWSKQISCFESDLCQYLSINPSNSIVWPIFGTSHSPNDQMYNALFEQLDALVLQGGSDVAPSSYGEETQNPQLWPGDIRRDNFEIYLIKKAIDYDLPILGICRGAQLLNAFFGGSLYQDIPLHKKKELYDGFSHEIIWDKESFMNSIYPQAENQGIVNSIHHQGIKILANDLISQAHYPVDGLIEAFKHKDKKIYGVQWHPEFSSALLPNALSSVNLWNWFLSQC